MKAAIFDLDGTLLDSMWIWVSIGIEPPKDLREKLKPLSLLKGCHYIKDRFNINKTAEQINDEMEKLLESYYSSKFELRPYVKETLEKFKGNNIRMCVATATAEHLVLKAFDRLGIGNYFEFIQTCNNTGIGKFDPEFFKLAINRLNIEPRDMGF